MNTNKEIVELPEQVQTKIGELTRFLDENEEKLSHDTYTILVSVLNDVQMREYKRSKVSTHTHYLLYALIIACIVSGGIELQKENFDGVMDAVSVLFGATVLRFLSGVVSDSRLRQMIKDIEIPMSAVAAQIKEKK